jgi:Spy/CpxP family protein refolding chaperone
MEDKDMRFTTRIHLTLVASLCIVCSVQSQAQDNPRPTNPPGVPQPDPLEENLYPPDLIQLNKETLRLSEEQQSAIAKLFRDLQEQLPDKEAQLRREVEALGRMIPQSTTDETALLGQLDKVLDRERDIKRLHLATMFQLRRQLTAEQLAQLQNIKKNMHTAEQRLQGRLQRVQQLIQQRVQESGHPPVEVVERMQAFPRLMQQGKITEAEALLEDTLRTLESAAR